MPRSTRAVLRRFALLALLVVPSAGCSVNGEEIVKVVPLPDTPDFQVRVAHAYGPGSDVKHVDVGYVWQQDKLLGCPVVNSNGRYVGYLDGDAGYLPLDKSEIDALVAKANVALPVREPIPFWDAWGGKLALLTIPALLTLSWLVDTRMRSNRSGADEAEAAPELGAVIARYRRPARPTLMLLVGYGLPAALLVMGATSVVGLVRAHELALSAIVAVGFLVPAGIVFLVASAFTRGHGVVLREGGLVRTTGRDALKIRYEDIQRVAVGAGRSAAYEVRFSPLYEHDFSLFSLDLASRAELDRLLAALAAKGVRVEAPERF